MSYLKTKSYAPNLRLLSLGFGLLTLVGLLLLAGSPSFQSTRGLSLFNVDPAIIEGVLNKKRIVGYAVIDPVYAVHLPLPLRSWRFGDYLILKYEFDMDTLLKVSRYAVYISSMREARIIDPIGILKRLSSHELMDDLEEGKEYHTDIKRAFHKASDRWTGKGVVVCVIDSGVDYLHPDLRDNVYALVSILVYANYHPLVWIKGVNGTLEDAWIYEQDVNATYGVCPWMDGFGHGTHVSGIICGSGTASRGEVLGLAPNASLVVIKAFRDDGTASTDMVLDALDWIKKHHREFNITVVNMGLGAVGPSDGRDPVSVACDGLADMGLILFASAGNNYMFPFTIAIPACARKVIAVGAINPYSCKIPSWTASGPTKDGRMKPDFITAGVWVLSTKPVTVKSYIEKVLPEAVRDQYYMWLSGTSMSCAVASGLACEWVEYYYYVFREWPSWRGVYEYFSKNAKKLNPLFKDFISGEGIPYAPE